MTLPLPASLATAEMPQLLGLRTGSLTLRVNVPDPRAVPLAWLGLERLVQMTSQLAVAACLGLVVTVTSIQPGARTLPLATAIALCPRALDVPIVFASAATGATASAASSRTAPVIRFTLFPPDCGG